MARRTNILWIVTTQWRARALGYAGDLNARTPHLDDWANGSVNYGQAVTPHPFGPFARAALLTGQPSPANGVVNYFDPLPVDARTVAHALSERGYETAFFGKWHLSPRDPRAALIGEVHAKTHVAPERRGGFNFWEGFESGFLLNDPWLHGTRLPEPVQFPGYQSDIVCDRAAAFLTTQGAPRNETLVTSSPGKAPPWFAVVSFEAPHPPYDAPSGGIGSSDPAQLHLDSNVPRGGEVEARARRELAGYYAHIEATDRAIGRLLRAASTPDTVVVFTSVHGDMHGAHGLFRKGWPYEESVRVPLLIRGPEALVGRPGKSTTALSLVELGPLTIGWAEGKRSVTDQDHSLISMPGVVALPQQCDRVWRGVRTETRKLVLNADGSPWLCFDLERDPLERENLADDSRRFPEFESLRRLLALETRRAEAGRRLR